MKKLLLAAFILLVLVQWLVPGKMIWDKNRVLQRGHTFRFETEPVDPSDPFRGRYITLNFKMDTFRMNARNGFELEDEIYVLLKRDEQGFARVRGVSLDPPANDPDYVKANAYILYDAPQYMVHISYPFEEFYLDEYKAPKAEQDYFNSTRDTTLKTYAVVKVYKGEAVIENVIVNNKPLVQ